MGLNPNQPLCEKEGLPPVFFKKQTNKGRS